jgi:hypothetical protein
MLQVFPIRKELLHPQEEMERHITDLIKKVSLATSSPVKGSGQSVQISLLQLNISSDIYTFPTYSWKYNRSAIT